MIERGERDRFGVVEESLAVGLEYAHVLFIIGGFAAAR